MLRGSGSSEPHRLFAVTLLGREHCWCVNNSLLEAKQTGGGQQPLPASPPPQPVAHPRPGLQSCWHRLSLLPQLCESPSKVHFPFFSLSPCASSGWSQRTSGGMSPTQGQGTSMLCCTQKSTRSSIHAHSHMQMLYSCMDAWLCSRASLCVQVWENHFHGQEENWESQV